MSSRSMRAFSSSVGITAMVAMRITTLAAMALEARRERKVISVVFADLVGFTARARSSLDPEDVEAFLRPYHEQLKADFERFGGTVEKFIGDAVVAVFGAPSRTRTTRSVPSARPSRSVTGSSNAAICEVRIAVNTGEAIVRVDAAPGARRRRWPPATS